MELKKLMDLELYVTIIKNSLMGNAGNLKIELHEKLNKVLNQIKTLEVNIVRHGVEGVC